MNTGLYISGLGHLVLILFLVFGGLWTSRRLPPVTVADVSVVSAEQFAALTSPGPTPDIATEQPAVPTTPVPDEAAPELAALPDAPPPVPEAERPTAPDPAQDAPVERPQLAVPEADVTDSVATVEPPPVPDDRPAALEEATPAPAPRVAPDAAPPSPPEAETAPVVVEQTAPLPSPEDPVPEVDEAAPDEATTEIVTEAERPTLAPATSPRPRPRPVRPAEAEASVEQAPAVDAVAAAIAEAVAEAGRSAPAPAGPPLSFGEREAFRVAVARCWDVDVGGRSADVTVTVGVTMTREGTVAGGEVRQIAAEGGDADAQRTAFEKARRAILRCQSGGFPLPADKYDSWREIEMTFNPEGMRLR